MPASDILSNDPSIRDVFRFVSEYIFSLGELDTKITVKVYECLASDVREKFFFKQSHFLQTPQQPLPYQTDVTFGDSEDRALIRAIRTLTTNYNAAIKGGYTPAESWLVANKDF